MYDATQQVINYAQAMEEGRRVARDVCGSDPERMTAIKIVEYLEKELPLVDGFTFSAEPVDPVKYPFCAAVDRAAKSEPTLMLFT